ncbi:hypothetical protein RHSIM_Rhsim05G0120700 [Rhododendron simsii]|uniref:Uncharacterized protein n=1 Tax=Rhododendron simsii TaxID=118357 RepID=A0A834H207_RHOSS|nr:hypothetical protein RHSIM_Rhsim05G0120700 [Rhododendron simsii]
MLLLLFINLVVQYHLMLLMLVYNIHSPSIAESQLVGGGPFPGTHYYSVGIAMALVLFLLYEIRVAAEKGAHVFFVPSEYGADTMISEWLK